MSLEPSTNPHSLSLDHFSDLSSTSASLSHARGNRHGPKHPKRYAPYQIPQHALYQLNVTYLNPTYVEDLVEIIMPRSPKQVLAAALEPGPPLPALRGDRIEGEGDGDAEQAVERGHIYRVFAWLVDLFVP